MGSYAIAEGTYHLRAEGLFPFFNFYFLTYSVAVFPDSLIMCGLFLIALEYRFGLYALPLFFATTSFWDLMYGHLQPDGPWSLVLLMEMLGGWVLTWPHFKNTLFVPVLALLFIIGIGYLSHVFEAGLFLFVVFSIESVQSPWGKRHG